MRFRFAAGMLLIIALHPLITYSQSALFRPDADAGEYTEGLRDLLFGPDGIEARTRVAIILRTLILVAAVVVAVVGLAASTNAVAPLVGIACIVLAVLNLQFVIWSWAFSSADSVPPDWLFRNPLWFPVPRLVGVGWILLLAGGAIIALTEPRPARQQAFPLPPPPPPVG